MVNPRHVRQIINVDGKTLRGSTDRGSGTPHEQVSLFFRDIKTDYMENVLFGACVCPAAPR